LIDCTRRAAGHVVALLDDYDAKDRPEAMRNLRAAMREAWADIEANPAKGLPAPCPPRCLVGSHRRVSGSVETKITPDHQRGFLRPGGHTGPLLTGEARQPVP